MDRWSGGPNTAGVGLIMWLRRSMGKTHTCPQVGQGITVAGVMPAALWCDFQFSAGWCDVFVQLTQHRWLVRPIVQGLCSGHFWYSPLWCDWTLSWMVRCTRNPFCISELLGGVGGGQTYSPQQRLHFPHRWSWPRKRAQYEQNKSSQNKLKMFRWHWMFQASKCVKWHLYVFCFLCCCIVYNKLGSVFVFKKLCYALSQRLTVLCWCGCLSYCQESPLLWAEHHWCRSRVGWRRLNCEIIF